MRFVVLNLTLLFSTFLFSQSYKELSEKAFIFLETDSLERAEDIIKEALNLEPSNPQNAILLSNLGTLQRKRGDLEDALLSYTYALNFAPNNIPILLNRASLYLDTDNMNRAHVDYSHVLDLNPHQSEALLFRGYINMHLHNYKQAETDYVKLLELIPENESGRIGLGTLYQKQKEFGKSFEIFNRLIIDFPNNPTYYINRADLEIDMDYLELALADVEVAMSFDPTLPELYILRGRVYLKQQQKKRAKKEFEYAISLGFPPHQLQEELQECK